MQSCGLARRLHLWRASPARRADLSVASDHHRSCRCPPVRRPTGRAHPSRAHARFARPDRHHRERPRRRRHASASVASRALRPTATRSHRRLGHARVVNGADLPAAIRSGERFRAGVLVATTPHADRRQERLPAHDLKEPDRLAEGQPGQGACRALVGTGSGGHICGLFFQKEPAPRFQFVPYRGAASGAAGPARRADRLHDAHRPVNSLPQVRAGNIKAYAVTVQEPLAARADVPTVDEAGVPGPRRRPGARSGRPGTPKDVVGKLNAAVVDALADPAIADAARRSRPGDLAARAADAGGARRLPQGRDRQVVADHQGGGHQGRMSRQGGENESADCSSVALVTIAGSTPRARRPIRRGRSR